MMSTHFISDLEQQLAYKKAEKDSIQDELTLIDVKIDRYDAIITNIDKGIIPLVDEINVAINLVKDAYDTRIANGCKSDLYWELTSTTKYSGSENFGEYTAYTYTVSKNPEIRTDYGYYGAKYYRKPQNQDYGRNIIKEIVGNIGSGKTELAILSTAGTFNLQIGDTLVDNIDNPYVFPSNNLPEIIGFGNTSVLGITTYFGGSIFFNSNVLVNTGTGTTLGISTGDFVVLEGTTVPILPPNTTVVGFGTGIHIIQILDPNSNNFINTSVIGNALILSSASIASGISTGTFSIGNYSTYPSLILGSPADHSATNANFTIIRNTQTEALVFDYTNNPIDPVTVGIVNNSTVGLGHKLVLVNDGSPIGPFQWKEVLAGVMIPVYNGVPYDYAPEPACGNGYARYYSGDNSWPVKETFSYTSSFGGGGGGGVVQSSTSSRATEGEQVTLYGYTVTNSETAPAFQYDIGYTSDKPPGAASNEVCNNYATTIASREASRDEIIARNVPKINGLIASSTALRGLRDKMEGQAFAILQGRASIDVEINKLKADIKALEATDLSLFEPEVHTPVNKFSSSTVGVSN